MSFLTAAELHDLTGYRRKSCQIAWLRAKRWRFEVSSQGFPKVARAYYQVRMVAAEPGAELAAVVRPNFALLRGGA